MDPGRDRTHAVALPGELSDDGVRVVAVGRGDEDVRIGDTCILEHVGVHAVPDDEAARPVLAEAGPHLRILVDDRDRPAGAGEAPRRRGTDPAAADHERVHRERNLLNAVGSSQPPSLYIIARVMRPRLPELRHPTQLVVVAFAAAIFVGAGLLSLPFATPGPGNASFLTAIFTSTSAVCVTGLIVVDTATDWSHFGQAVIMILVQVGGFGIMTLASLLALLVARRLGLRGRPLAQAETGALQLGDVRRVLLGVAFFSLLFETFAATVIALRLGITTTTPRARQSGVGSSTRSPPSTTPASRSGATTLSSS